MAAAITALENAVAFDWYVDSVFGADGNAGTSATTALKTMAALATKAVDGKRIGLARGSYWREQYDLPSAVSASMGIYGSGNPPVFDGADVVTQTWTQPDVVTYPNVWSISWTRNWTPIASTEYLYLWVDGVLARDATSLADLQTNGGWWFSSRTTVTTTVYIKSVADPNTSGVVYELPMRHYGLSSHYIAINTGTPRTMTTVGPIEGKRGVGHYGPINHGLGDVSRLLIRFGSAHHIVTQSDTSTDIICADMPVGYSSGSTAFTAYTPSGAGRSHTAKRVFCIGDAAPQYNDGLYAHDGAGGWDNITFEQCGVTNGAYGTAASVSGTGIARGIYTNAVAAPISLLMGTTATVSYCQTREPGNGAGVADAGPVDTTSRTRLVEHCVFYGTGPIIRMVNALYRNGSLTVRNCVFILPASVTDIDTTASTSLSIDFNHNLFICGTTPSLFKPFHVSNGAGALSLDYNAYCIPFNGMAVDSFRFEDDAGYVRTLALWQARTGQDAHSVTLWNRPTLLTDLFSGSVANGDFRMKPAATHGLVFSDGTPFNAAGPQQHWDWNARAAVAGPPTAWPVLPANLSEYRAYLNNPAGWIF